MNGLQGLSDDVRVHLEKYLDLGDLIRLDKAEYREKKVNSKFARCKIKQYIKDKNTVALESLLREESGFNQFARRGYLELCIKESSYDCWVILHKHLQHYKKVRDAIVVYPLNLPCDDSLKTESFVRLVRYCQRGNVRLPFWNGSIVEYLVKEILYPHSVYVLSRRSESIMKEKELLYGPEIMEEVRKILRKRYFYVY